MNEKWFTFNFELTYLRQNLYFLKYRKTRYLVKNKLFGFDFIKLNIIHLIQLFESTTWLGIHDFSANKKKRKGKQRQRGVPH